MIGLAALRHVKHPRELLLAVVPLLFAFQQTIEGVLWLQLSGQNGSGNVPALSLAFLIFAEVLWPAYPALAVLLIEPDPRRRHVLRAIAIVGAILSIYLLTDLLTEPRTATIHGHSIAYTSDVNPLSWLQVPYILCTCAPLLFSSHRIIQIFFAVALVGFLVSAYVYFATFISVWCFFAAAGSTLLYFYFKRAAVSVRLSHI